MCSQDARRRPGPQPTHTSLSDFGQEPAKCHPLPTREPGCPCSGLALPRKPALAAPWPAGGGWSLCPGRGGGSPRHSPVNSALLPQIHQIHRGPAPGSGRDPFFTPCSPVTPVAAVPPPPSPPDLRGEQLGEKAESDVVLPQRGSRACQIGPPESRVMIKPIPLN